MIRHMVLVRFKPDIAEQEISEIFGALSDLTDTLLGARGFTGGRSQSPEQIERGFMHAFVIDFDAWADLKTYAEHPEHRALGARIVDSAVGGVEGLIVLDIETREQRET
ncbi:Dabb family protein [Anianabacter salinae]|uniref:Dabb family protein n=1 Tax=Anianabacter salinae TaxID=2851023 RepID=UPI00225DF6A5|nr:Dabb family protein [Anianabacter salinae]MBV0912745.1 Dabb family protein [Anianabacter salinae]